MKLEVERLDRASLAYVRANLRPYDRRELEVQGYDDAAFSAHLDHPYAYALTAASVPIAVHGAVPWGNRLFLWAFGTEAADVHMIEFHRIAVGFLDWIERVEWQLLPSVLVWEGHTPSLRWLDRLGFTRTPYTAQGLSNERILLMERSGRCAG